MKNMTTRLTRIATIALGLTLSVGLMSCSDDNTSSNPGAPGTTPSSTPSGGPQARTAHIPVNAMNLGDQAFGPPLTVPVGTTVTWINDDTITHTVTARDGTWESPFLNQG